MKKNISPKTIALIFGVLVIFFAVAFYVVAWQEPSQAPPGGNVPAPLNTGPTAQSKEGGLIINTGGATTGLIIDKGSICIGSDCRNKWPETGVVTTYRLEATSYKVGDKYYGKSVSYNCPTGSNVVNIYLSQNNVRIQGASGGGCVWGCTGPCPYTEQNSCSYSISGTTATLNARIVVSTEVDCACCVGYGLTDYCYPYSTPPWGYPKINCSLPGGSPQCVMEFQCGIKQTMSP